ncbi:MAG: hypothetical protein KJ023_23570, partial [Burkholderiaceae bacterium]|nr:hypothetical protein [Burkholderiaceae bacterium]
MKATVDPARLEAAGLLVDHEQAPPAALTDDSARALAWAIKELCYGAWSSQPRRAVRAAAAMRQLLQVARTAGLK